MYWGKFYFWLYDADHIFSFIHIHTHLHPLIQIISLLRVLADVIHFILAIDGDQFLSLFITHCANLFNWIAIVSMNDDHKLVNWQRINSTYITLYHSQNWIIYQYLCHRNKYSVYISINKLLYQQLIWNFVIGSVRIWLDLLFMIYVVIIINIYLVDDHFIYHCRKSHINNIIVTYFQNGHS